MNQLFTSLRHRALFQTFVLCTCILALCLAATARQPTIVTFDPPGSVFTAVEQINPSGTIVGIYQDATGLYHGFTRTKDGKITAFDAPGAGTGPLAGTGLFSINPSGTTAGQYLDPNYMYHAWVRTAQGKFTAFEAPDAGTGHGQGTVQWNVNASGDTAGGYINSGDFLQGTQVLHGFFRTSDGTLTEYDAPGAGSGPGQGTLACASDCLNAAGDTAGSYTDSAYVSHGFIRDKHGNVTEFDPPGASNGTYASGIDAGGEVVGAYLDANDVFHGFLREKNGRITDVDVPGAGTGSFQGTYINSIADNGAVSGNFFDANGVSHGFARAANGKITTFDAPGAGKGTGQGTAFYSSNNPSGAVAGSYVDSNNVYHGFLYTPCDDDDHK